MKRVADQMDYQQLEEAARRARELPEPAREAFLENVSGGNRAVQKQIATLIQVHETSAGDAPPIGEKQTSDTSSPRRFEPRSINRRYKLRGQLATGGMGVIYRVADANLNRELALKRMKTADDGSSGGSSQSKSAFDRFLEEAQITSKLDHPGIVPVHDLGIDGEGRLFFTMKLVAGRTLTEVIDRLHNPDSDTTLNRVIGVLIKVCEALAYAHDRGVIHRDLKPANIMVGRFGEVYVMDWGLARVINADAEDSIRLASLKQRPEEKKERASVTPQVDEDIDLSVRFTLDGEVLGTPGFLSPEQAAGDILDLDERADVFALGAILYNVLTGKVAYVAENATPDIYKVLKDVQTRPPRAIHKWNREAPDELIAICERAMQLRPEKRYQSISEMGEDLHAFVEGRVVTAYEGGAVAELRKWVSRNRSFAAICALLFVVTVGGSVALGVQQSWARSSIEDRERTLIEKEEALARNVAELEEKKEELDNLNQQLESQDETLQQQKGEIEQSRQELANQQAVLTERETRLEEAQEKLDATQAELDTEQAMRTAAEASLVESEQVRALLGELEVVRRLRDGVPPLWPLSQQAPTAKVEAYRTWIRESGELQTRLARHQSNLDQLRARTSRSAEEEEQLRHLERIVGEASPIFGGEDSQLAATQRLLELALTVTEVASPELDERWRTASQQIARSRTYRGMKRLRPQPGLYPLGPNPAGYWEFLHVLSGDFPATETQTGDRAISAETGMVLVLLPGGKFQQGATINRSGEAEDTAARPHEMPPHQVTLSPFLISKFELTQAQAQRVLGRNPSTLTIGAEQPGRGELVDGAHPVESLSWQDANTSLPAVGLALPTESQWEYATRAGRATRWWIGREPESVQRAGNVADATRARYLTEQGQTPTSGELESWQDDWVMHAPVGRWQANQFGLYDTVGNVAEWCLDALGNYSSRAANGDQPRSRVRTASSVVARGGSFLTDSFAARSTARRGVPAGAPQPDVGVRPIYALQDTPQTSDGE